MRISFNGLIVLAILATSLSGCKVRGPRGGVTRFLPVKACVTRTSGDGAACDDAAAPRRGTVDCECFTCRTRRQNRNSGCVCLIQDPATRFITSTPATGEVTAVGSVQSFAPDLPCEIDASTNDATTVDCSPVVGDQNRATDPCIQQEMAPPFSVMEPAPVVESDPLQDHSQVAPTSEGQTVEGQIIEPAENSNSPGDAVTPTNETPTEETPTPVPMLDTDSSESTEAASDDQPALTDMWSSDVDTNSDSEPGVVPADGQNIEIDQPRASEPDDNGEPAPSEVPARKSSFRRDADKPSTLPIYRRNPAPPNPVSPAAEPMIEHEKIRQPAQSDAIVLRARPVEHHRVYNRRSQHAPVRQAQLLGPPVHAAGTAGDAPVAAVNGPDQTAETPGRFAPPQFHFRKLPPMEANMPQPAPAAAMDLSPLPTPVPETQEAPVLKGSSATDDTANQARVVESAAAPLLLKAVARGDDRPMHPVVNITTMPSTTLPDGDQPAQTLHADASPNNRQESTAMKLLPLFKVDSMTRQAIDRSTSTTIDR